MSNANGSGLLGALIVVVVYWWVAPILLGNFIHAIVVVGACDFFCMVPYWSLSPFPGLIDG